MAAYRRRRSSPVSAAGVLLLLDLPPSAFLFQEGAWETRGEACRRTRCSSPSDRVSQWQSGSLCGKHHMTYCASVWIALAGLAAGGLLAALFMGGALEGINMMDILMLAALMGAIFFVVRMLRRPRQDHSAAPMQYSGMGAAGNRAGATAAGTAQTAAPSSMTGATASAPVSDRSANIPADFKVEPFLRNAKTSFIRLQAANDSRDLNDIREYTTPEMYAEISMEISERGDALQKTEVIAINADLLEVVTENDTAIASVRFNGQLRESSDASPVPFDEIWHVQKNLKDPEAVWLLAGIQQVS